MARLLPVAIVLFWLGSVAWLAKVVWAPPGSRMMPVDPREVYDVFFAWNESTNMTLLENGVRRGQVTVLGGAGEDPETGRVERVASVSGSLERYDERSQSNLVDLFWKGSLVFTESMERIGAEASVRIPNRELSAQLIFGEPGEPIGATVKMGDREILKLGGAGSDGTAAALPGLLSVLGPMVPGGGGSLLDALDPSSMKFEIEARMGDFNLAGRDLRAFLLTFRTEEPGYELRVFLSEVGEPLRIETDFGFEAVSEILVPLDAYKRQLSKNPE